MYKSRTIIPIFIPHKGCPHDCSFCNQKKIAGEGSGVGGDKADQIISDQLENLKATNRSIEVAFYGGSFTGLPIKDQVDLLTAASKKKEAGLIDEIRLSTRPDCIQEEILDILQKYGVSTIELGVQSTDDRVLNLNNRGHTKEDVSRAVGLIKKRQISLGLQMMVGLYGDTEEGLLNTAEDIVGYGADFVRIYPTIVIKDTLLESLYLEGKYEPISLEEAVYLCKKLVVRFNRDGLPIIRLGLQATEEISVGKSIAAGPYHPAFRELVETEIYKDLIEDRIRGKVLSLLHTSRPENDLIEEMGENYKPYGAIQERENKSILKIDNGSINLDEAILKIYCNIKDPSKVSGYKQSNKNYFKNKYNIKDIKIYPAKSMPLWQINIELSESL